MANMRQAILDELKRQGKTRNWLADQSGIEAPSVYQFLSGEQGMSIDRVEKMMGILKLRIVSSGDDKRGKSRP